MYGLGTIINTAAIVAGGAGGALFGRFLKKNVQDTLTVCCGVSTPVHRRHRGFGADADR